MGGVVIAVYFLSVGAAFAATFSPACPCIDPWANIVTNDSCRRSSPDVTPAVCTPLDYGASRCAAWDNQSWHPECRLPGAPEYCTSEFCYVNASNCSRPHSPTAYFAHLNQDIAFSYQTCGFLNRFSKDAHTKALHQFTADRPLRVGFPTDSGSGYTVTTMADGVTRDGSFVQFAARVFRAQNVSWEARPISQKSVARYAKISSYTACVHDVALGELDMCVGNFWVTSERKLMSPFTSAIYGDNIYFITQKTGVDSKPLWKQMEEPFLPFNMEVWLCSLAVILYVSLGVHACEAVQKKQLAEEAAAKAASGRQQPSQSQHRKQRSIAVLSSRSSSMTATEDEERGRHSGGTRDARVVATEPRTRPTLAPAPAPDVEPRSRCPSCAASSCEAKALQPSTAMLRRLGCLGETEEYIDFRWHVERLGKTLYQSLLGYVSGGPAYDAHTFPARLMNIGFGLFVVVSLAMYTAQLTSNLVADSAGAGADTLLAALGRRESVCVIHAVEKSLVSKFPQLGKLSVSAATDRDALRNMDAGLCQHVLMMEDAWRNAQSGTLLQDYGGPAHCNKTKVGTALFTIENAMPVREELQFPMSWVFTKYLEQGWYEEEVLIAHKRYIRPNRCATAERQQEANSRLGLGRLAGPMLVSIACTTVAVIVHWVHLTVYGNRLFEATQWPRAISFAKAKLLGIKNMGAKGDTVSQGAQDLQGERGGRGEQSERQKNARPLSMKQLGEAMDIIEGIHGGQQHERECEAAV